MLFKHPHRLLTAVVFLDSVAEYAIEFVGMTDLRHCDTGMWLIFRPLGQKTRSQAPKCLERMSVPTASPHFIDIRQMARPYVADHAP